MIKSLQLSMKNLLNKYNLEVYDINNNEFHGGCSRYFISKKNKRKINESVNIHQKNEDDFGLKKIETFFIFNSNLRLKLLTYV